MKNMIEGWLIRKSFCVKNLLNDFLHEEKGASDMVVVIVLIVIVVALAAIFKDRLESAADAVFGKLDTFIQ